jgi:hypothetical protein
MIESSARAPKPSAAALGSPLTLSLARKGKGDGAARDGFEIRMQSAQWAAEGECARHG